MIHQKRISSSGKARKGTANCEAGPCEPGVTPNTVQVSYAGCFYLNSVHPTSPLIAAYMANQIDAPTTVVPQGYKDGGFESPWSVYGNVNYGGGALDRQFLAAGYDYDAIGGMVGAEYRVNPRLLARSPLASTRDLAELSAPR